MQSIVDDLNAPLSNTALKSDCIIIYSAVENAVHHLKPGQNDGSIGFTSDHTIHASDDLLVHMSFLFTSIIVDGNAVDSFCLAQLRPCT